VAYTLSLVKIDVMGQVLLVLCCSLLNVKSIIVTVLVLSCISEVCNSLTFNHSNCDAGLTLSSGDCIKWHV